VTAHPDILPRYTHRVGFSSTIALMHPTLVTRPFHQPGWVYEEKYDGWRLVVHKADGQVRLISRHGLDHTRRFPARRGRCRDSP
jgi:ATP-dependent DNA ligase